MICVPAIVCSLLAPILLPFLGQPILHQSSVSCGEARVELSNFLSSQFYRIKWTGWVESNNNVHASACHTDKEWTDREQMLATAQMQLRNNCNSSAHND
jgi:hypothetical protein